MLFHSFSLIFAFLITTLFGCFLSLPIIRNLKKLETGIEKIRMGDLSTRVVIPARRPTGPLADRLNHMARRIQALLEHQKHLIQAVAHEIRTPISRIRFHLEMLVDAHDKEETGPLVTDIAAEVEKLNRLVNELLTYSTLDAMTEEMETSAMPLQELLSEVAAYHRKTHPHIRLALKNTGDPNHHLLAVLGGNGRSDQP